MQQEPLREWARRLTEPGAAALLSDRVEATAAERIALAWAVKDLCIEAWTAEPQRTQRCAALLADLERHGNDPEIAAAAAWCDGLAQLARGQMEAAMVRLDEAQARLHAIGQAQRAAQSQITKVMALAMLGRHDEAVASGERTLAQLLAAGDELGAGKVELNLGWMLLRRDRYDAASARFRRAAVRFARAGDVTHSILADIGQASALTWQFEFDEALRLYERSSMRARARQLTSVQGVVDSNRGRLELHRGRHGAALTCLEAALREAERDGLPQDVAEARRDLADTYLALNLLPEALALYEQTIDACRALEHDDECAWAELQQAQALARQGDTRRAAEGLARAQGVFEAQGNAVAAALAGLPRAALDLRRGDPAAGLQRAVAAAAAFGAAKVEGWRAEAELISAEALASIGQPDAAEQRYRQTLQVAQALPELAAACHTGLGLLMRQRGQADRARVELEHAVELADAQRSALANDELRTAYGADKQRPHDALIDLALDDRSPSSAARLLRALERARAPALHAALARPQSPGALDPALRERLHWLHGQWLQALHEGDTERAAVLESRRRGFEQEWLEQQRRRQAQAGAAADDDAAAEDALDIEALQVELGPDQALVAYGVLEQRLAVCVVTGDAVHGLAVAAAGLDERITQLRFQIDALRFGAPGLRAHATQIGLRARTHLQALHAQLWQPIVPLLAGRERVLVVPHRSLHYVPFCALHDGRHSLLDHHELSLTPSATLWLAGRRARSVAAAAPPRRVVAVGVGGEALPHVAEEVQAVAQAFAASAGGQSTLLLEARATHAALCAAVPGADVLHLACHGQFRADSPYFSALHLGDGPLTVRDAASLPLKAQLVTLSACETGVSRIAPGDELLGLLRGFLLAGAPRVLATQWTVDDAGTAQLMAHFYRAVLAGARPAAALREAQQALAQQQPHPYYWAPFTLHERA